MNMLSTVLLLGALAHSLPPEVSLLEGCWGGESGDIRIEENYSSTSGNTMLGNVKTLREGKVVFFEFVLLRADETGTWLKPFPRGRDNAPLFHLVETEADKLVFENSTHDFPRRITFRRQADGTLLTRIAGTVGGKAKIEEYVTMPRSCAP